MSKKLVRNYKGMPYEVVGNTVTVFDEAGNELVSGTLEIGVSVYHSVQKLANSLKVRESKPKSVGNFTYEVDEDATVVVYRKDGSVLATKELGKSALHNLKSTVMKIIVSTLE